MNEAILLVDDEPMLLDSLRRQLRREFMIQTAAGPEEGLAAVTQKGPFAVIVSDLRMPVMNGIQFLKKTREVTPDSVRIILTGNADVQNAIQSVNEGHVFRFLTKPCPPDLLVETLNQALTQYRLITAEKELLEQTLTGSIQMLTELMGLLKPEAFGRAARIKRYAREVAVCLDIPDLWKIETSAMLSQVGWITVPEFIIQKHLQGKSLTAEELHLFEQHPRVTSGLLAHIPRIQEIADMIACQNLRFDGQESPKPTRQGKDIPIGARILKVVSDFDLLEVRGLLKPLALKQMKQQPGAYDPEVLAALEQVLGMEARYALRGVRACELVPHMILAEDVKTRAGLLLITRGHEISELIIQRLITHSGASSGIAEPIRVFIPMQLAGKKGEG
ncbi:MAG: HD domain-containing phosphohydrolase [Desulfatirhabdiaceae bacterium]